MTDGTQPATMVAVTKPGRDEALGVSIRRAAQRHDRSAGPGLRHRVAERVVPGAEGLDLGR